MKPVRIQRKRTKGYDMQAESRKINGLECVYVGRPTRWGNKYRVGCNGVYDADFAVECFETMLRDGPEDCFPSEEEIIKHLKGKNLACWCKRGRPCHADILLKIANEIEP